MKVVWSLLIWSLLAVWATSARAGDLTGFRDFKWGSARPTAGMILVIADSSSAGSCMYKLSRDVLAVGSAKMDSIHYGYQDDKLNAVKLMGRGVGSYNSLVKAIRALYGTPETGSLALPNDNSWAQTYEKLEYRSGTAIGICTRSGKVVEFCVFLVAKDIPEGPDAGGK